jgi:hypothetical protein
MKLKIKTLFKIQFLFHRYLFLIFQLIIPSYQGKMNILSSASLKGLSYLLFPGGFQTKQDLDLATPLVGFFRTVGLVLPSFFILQKMNELSGLYGIEYDQPSPDYYFKYFSRKFLFTTLTLTSFFKMKFIESMAYSPNLTALSKINSTLFSFFNSKKSNNIQLGLLGTSLLLFYFFNVRILKNFDLEAMQNRFEELKNKKEKAYQETNQSKENEGKENEENINKINNLKKLIQNLETTLNEPLEKLSQKNSINKINFLEKYMISLRLEIFNRYIQEIDSLI